MKDKGEKIKEIADKIIEWRNWCENDMDDMNDHIRDFFGDTLSKNDLFLILEIIAPTV